MIDSHCHLTDPRLAEQLDMVLERAAAAGVERMITIGTDIDDAIKCIELCRSLENVRCAIGVHPNHCGQVPEEDLPRLRELQSDRSVIALGEMGLDYHHHFAPPDRQKEVFEFQLQVATELKRAVVIHCREATDDCLAIMRGFPRVRAVFHCFTGSIEEARKILDAGYLLGFTGAVTFKKNDALREACALVPLDRLLIETDAPYLTPEPVRKQKTNEPAFVAHVAAVVARVKNRTVAELDRITTRNVAALFGWPHQEKSD
ncbi:MAG TPA: TatD family hydrolase [Tepidisphaeraceae bacterium]|jgi:TatD DNase family protein|nr:TatD family hydrolase [Tepidisphaeraceae bacterium]